MRRRTVACKGCGARNLRTANRCKICTAQMDIDLETTWCVARQAMYQSKVSKRAAPRRAKSIFAIALVVYVVGVFGYNYFFAGFGPSWAHRPMANNPGDSWVTYKDFAGEIPGRTTSMRLPGPPIEGAYTGGRKATTVVDANWNAVLDRDTTSPAAEGLAEEKRAATVVVAVTTLDPATTPPEALIADLLPGVQLADVHATSQKTASLGVQTDVTGRDMDYPTPQREGRFEARFQRLNGRTLVAATFYEQGYRPEMHQFLLHNLQLDEHSATA